MWGIVETKCLSDENAGDLWDADEQGPVDQVEGEEEHGEGDPGQRTNERRGPRSRDWCPPITAHLE